MHRCDSMRLPQEVLSIAQIASETSPYQGDHFSSLDSHFKSAIIAPVETWPERCNSCLVAAW